ncbi:MAG: hypothetical protein HYV28_12955 [Ignavibacteriales bacterium]|nr:hypothetical protein [Ignavibacteriales bacterium]
MTFKETKNKVRDLINDIKTQTGQKGILENKAREYSLNGEIAKEKNKFFEANCIQSSIDESNAELIQRENEYITEFINDFETQIADKKKQINDVFDPLVNIDIHSNEAKGIQNNCRQRESELKEELLKIQYSFDNFNDRHTNL